MIIGIVLQALSAWEQNDEAKAKKSLSPAAALISLPLQFNQDDDIGP